jgi:outer membrane receptor protein involved in Fe transport
VRIDHQLSDSDSFFARFTTSDSERDAPENYPEYSTLQSLKVRLFSLSETHVISPQMLNNFRASFNRIDPSDVGSFPDRPAELLSFPGQPSPELSPGSGITALAGSPRSQDYWTTNRFQVYDDVNLTLGSHGLQFGGMLERMQFNMNFENRNMGVWSFPNLTEFLAARPNRYRGTPPYPQWTAIRGFRSFFFALYVQDDWKITPKLTLNLGLRWEPYTVPTEVNGRIANQRNLMDPAVTLGNHIGSTSPGGTSVRALGLPGHRLIPGRPRSEEVSESSTCPMTGPRIAARPLAIPLFSRNWILHSMPPTRDCSRMG